MRFRSERDEPLSRGSAVTRDNVVNNNIAATAATGIAVTRTVDATAAFTSIVEEAQRLTEPVVDYHVGGHYDNDDDEDGDSLEAQIEH